MTSLKGKGKAAVKIGMQCGKFTQDFTSLQNENEKPVSELLPVQFVSPQYVHIVVLQHKSEWMGFLTELFYRLTGA